MNTLPVMQSITMTSREIAELMGKEHFHVLRDIRIMLEQLSANPNLDWHCKLVKKFAPDLPPRSKITA